MSRIGTRYQYDNYSRTIQQTYGRMVRTQQELLTGKRADLSVNNPAGTAVVVRSSVLKNAVVQYQNNLVSANDYLKNSESALGEINTLLQEAYQLGLQGANSSTDQAARDVMANQVSALQRRLVELGNAQGGSNQYLFGGQLNTSAPFAVAGPTVAFSGDNNDVVVEVAAGQTLPVNTRAGTMITNAYNALESLRSNLQSGSLSLISGADLQALQSSMATVRTERGRIGASLQEVQTRTTQNTRRIDELTERIADVEEVDMAEALTEFQLAQTAYQAALTSITQAQRLSLMDYIR